jgi:DNA-3-methyladenine glycosylase (3mg)
MRLKRGVFARKSLLVAQDLLGCYLVRQFDDGKVEKRIITEVEAYGGIEDKASHARFGKTKRNSVMWEAPGLIYVYFVYGAHWMFNVVTGKIGEPQAVLVRSVDGIRGPGRVGRWLILDKSFYGEDAVLSKRIWFEEGEVGVRGKIIKSPRIGVGFAKEWAKKKWRFTLIFDER